jgi:hypothetical protein
MQLKRLLDYFWPKRKNDDKPVSAKERAYEVLKLLEKDNSYLSKE